MLGHVSSQISLLQRETTYESSFYSEENMNAAE